VGEEETQERIVEALRTCFDPEIPVNIYDLGLIYEVKVSDEGHAYVKMTLTSPACPVAGQLVGEVEAKTAAVEGVSSVEVDLVWDPPWDQSMLSEAAKLQLGLG
jgi:FeS assembly SUF system protein